MCARFSLTVPAELLVEFFGLSTPPLLSARYNIAPSQLAPIVRVEDGERAVREHRFGLLPAHAAPGDAGFINARAETVFDKRAFSESVRVRRCVVPASGFYEWARDGAARLPVLFRSATPSPLLCLAGVWARWSPPMRPRQTTLFGDPRPREVLSFAILTTTANEVVGPVHPRMPVLLDEVGVEVWLDPRHRDPARLRPLLRPAPARALRATPVHPAVNSPRLEGPECWRPPSPGPPN